MGAVSPLAKLSIPLISSGIDFHPFPPSPCPPTRRCSLPSVFFSLDQGINKYEQPGLCAQRCLGFCCCVLAWAIAVTLAASHQLQRRPELGQNHHLSHRPWPRAEHCPALRISPGQTRRCEEGSWHGTSGAGLGWSWAAKVFLWLTHPGAQPPVLGMGLNLKRSPGAHPGTEGCWKANLVAL